MSLNAPARAFGDKKKKKGCGWKSAINQMDLAGWNSACLMCGVLSAEGLVPVLVFQSVPVSSRGTARVLKKLHLFSAGQQKGTEFRQRYKWCIHVRRQRALRPKVRSPNFSSPLSFCCSSPDSGFSRKLERRTRPHVIICIMRNTQHRCFVSCGRLICGNDGGE